MARGSALSSDIRAGTDLRRSTRPGAALIRVEVLEERLVADVDLILLQHGRHRHDDGELLRIPLKSFAIVSTVRSPDEPARPAMPC